MPSMTKRSGPLPYDRVILRWSTPGRPQFRQGLRSGEEDRDDEEPVGIGELDDGAGRES